LAAAITERTRWLFLNSPSNPSGSVYTANELGEIASVLLRHPEVLILSDDIYEHLLFNGATFATIAAVEPRLAERTVTVNGVSKAYCMTGWRIGYAAGHKKLIEAMGTVQSQVTSCPSSISQAAACAALDGPRESLSRLRTVFRARRDLVIDALARVSGLRCATPDGAFYAFISCAGVIEATAPSGARIRSDRDYADYLLDFAGVAVVPGTVFGAVDYFRISYAAETNALAEACRRIAKATNDLD
jgi:aspartate aminotransferase